MTISVYEIGEYLGEPFTIFAHDDDEAEQIHREWIAAHRPGAEPEMPIVHVYASKLLAARTLLKAAADLNMSGVGYWDEKQGFWRIEKPGHPLTGVPTPSWQGINCYRVEVDDGLMYLAFARDVDAAEAFLDDVLAERPVVMKMHLLSPFRLVSTMATLRDDMHAALEGLAHWSVEGGWRISAPELATEVGGFIF